jgi:hypothetical protein
VIVTNRPKHIAAQLRHAPDLRPITLTTDNARYPLQRVVLCARHPSISSEEQKQARNDISTEKAFAETTAACNTRCAVPQWAGILVRETVRFTCKRGYDAIRFSGDEAQIAVKRWSGKSKFPEHQRGACRPL